LLVAWSAFALALEADTADRVRDPRDPRVVLIAAEPMARAGLARALAGQFDVVGSVDTVAAADALLTDLKPALSVSVLDPDLRDAPLDEACARILDAHPSVRGLVLFHNPTLAAVRTAVRHGARAVFDLSLSAEHVRQVLLDVEGGAVRVAPTLLPHLLDQHAPGGNPGHVVDDLLTEREHNALSLIAQGYTSKEIASLVGVSVKAVDMAVERAARRLRAAHRAHAVAIAVRDGLVTPW
jgi:DNA-binding NarL/FixJ family response regulator